MAFNGGHYTAAELDYVATHLAAQVPGLTPAAARIWVGAEQGYGNNPLGVSGPVSGQIAYFPNVDAGIAEAARWINTFGIYGPLRTALRSSSSLGSQLRAIANSLWNTGRANDMSNAYYRDSFAGQVSPSLLLGGAPAKGPQSGVTVVSQGLPPLPIPKDALGHPVGHIPIPGNRVSDPNVCPVGYHQRINNPSAFTALLGGALGAGWVDPGTLKPGEWNDCERDDLGAGVTGAADVTHGAQQAAGDIGAALQGAAVTVVVYGAILAGILAVGWLGLKKVAGG